MTYATDTTTPTTTTAPDPVAQAAEALVAELMKRGFAAEYTPASEDGPATVTAKNRTIPDLSEKITVMVHGGEARHYFWWSWAQRVAPITDVPLAATKIENVIRG